METVTILLSEYQTLLTRVKSLEEQVQGLLASDKELSAENAALKEKVLSLRNQLFGKKKDQIENSKKPIFKICDKQIEKGKVGRKAIDDAYSPDETINCDYKCTPQCKDCQREMHFVGYNDSHHEEYSVRFKKVKVSQAKYACRKCNNMVVADGIKHPIAKGKPMSGLLTKVILDKFSNATPFYRQAQNYSYSNIDYSRQMLNHWFSRAADLVEPLVNVMFKKILASDYIMVDETTLTLLNMNDKPSGGKGHVCVIKQGGKEFNYVYCWAIDSRKQEVISKKLSNFKGYLQTDGLNFYFVVQTAEGVIALGCWAHVRRKFVEIVNLSGKEEGIAFEVVLRIKELYAIEFRGASLSAKELLEMRQEKALPILNELKIYLDSHIDSIPPKSSLGIAIKYTLERWEALLTYTNDPRLSIDNNPTERCIKYLVIGRKNWLFADNIDSAGKIALIYSLVISCKANNINPQEYLSYIFSQLPYINKHDINELEKLLPDQYDLNKRFDQEYLEKHGMVKTITEPKAEIEVLVAA